MQRGIVSVWVSLSYEPLRFSRCCLDLLGWLMIIHTFVLYDLIVLIPQSTPIKIYLHIIYNMIKYNPIHTLHASNRGSRATTWAWSTKAPRTTISTWSCGGLFSFMIINCLRAAPHDANASLTHHIPINPAPHTHISYMCMGGFFYASCSIFT